MSAAAGSDFVPRLSAYRSHPLTTDPSITRWLGQDEAQWLRFCFAYEDAALRDAVERLKKLRGAL